MPLRRLINLLVKCVDLVDEPANQKPFLVVKNKEDGVKVEGAVWTTAYVNDLPDSAFLLVDDGGSKDGEGKTTPRSLRHLPYRDKDGKVDLPHLRNALARIPQMKKDEATKKRLTEHARQLLAREGGGSSKEKAMETTSIQGDAAAEAGVVAAASSESSITKTMATAEAILGAEQALAKQLSDAVQDVIQSVVNKSMTPERAQEAMKASADLIEDAMKEPDAELRAKALTKAKELVDRCRKSVTTMQPGPQVPFPTGAGGESPTGVTKPDGNLKPQFTSTEKGFTAGTGPSGNKNIPTGAGGTSPEGSPTAPPKVSITSFPGGSDITDAIRKAAEDLTKAVEMMTKAFSAAPPPVEKKDAAEPPLVEKKDAAEPPLVEKKDAAEPNPVEKKDAAGTIGPQGSSEGPMAEVAKALREVSERMTRLEKGDVGPGTKAAQGGSEGDAAGVAAVEKSFWANVLYPDGKP